MQQTGYLLQIWLVNDLFLNKKSPFNRTGCKCKQNSENIGFWDELVLNSDRLLLGFRLHSPTTLFETKACIQPEPDLFEIELICDLPG